MELMFNELSEEPLCLNKTEAFERVDLLIATYKEANARQANKIRFHKGYESIELAPGYSLNDYCCEPKHSRTKGLLLRGLFKMPFIDDNSAEEEQYIKNSFTIKKGDSFVQPYGLAAAFIYHVPAIGFLSEDFWDACCFELMVNATEEKAEKVICLSKPEHLKDQFVNDFIEERLPVNLLKTKLKSENKIIKLRDDHGKDILEAFSSKIIQFEYVESVINSLPYNPNCNSFIKEVYPDGKIELVLTKTDKGLGIIVKTTGRNLRETKEIARLLDNRFNK